MAKPESATGALIYHRSTGRVLDTVDQGGTR
jgi:hypothetical protein